MNNSALILIDLQNDFMAQGMLPIPDAETIIPMINPIMHQFDFVVATQNWHTKDHIDFASCHLEKNSAQNTTSEEKLLTLFPEHCIQDTYGAELCSDLDTAKINHVLRKGMKSTLHHHSAFFEQEDTQPATHATHATGLHTLLKFNRIKRIYLSGLSVSHSLENTALDAITLGYQVYLLLDICRSLPDTSLENHAPHYAKLIDTKVKLINTQDLHAIPKQLTFAFYDE
jgi:nicotinamidase/pyrazinamidase